MDELKIMPGAEPFFYPGNRIGCLTLHGLTGTPFEVRWLGKHLHQQGWTVYGPRLAGHGTTPDDLAHVRWREWYADVLAGYQMLRGQCDRVFVLGLSMGGALALLLSAREPVDGLVTMSAIYELNDPRRPLLPLVDLFIDVAPKGYDEAELRRFEEHIRTQQIARGEELIPRPSYPVWVVPAARQLIKMLDVLHREAGNVVAPALLVQSKADETVTFDNLQAIYESIGSQDKRTLVLERSGHVVTEDVEYEQVLAAAADFIRAHV